MPEPDANRVAFGLELGSADAEVLPGVRFHPDLVPQVLAVEAREADVVVRKSAPGLGALVIADLASYLLDLAVLLLEFFDEAGEIHQMLLEQVRPTKAVEHDQVMSGPCRNLSRGACRFLEVRNVIDSDGDAVLFSPVLREAIEPGIKLGNEVTPLNYLQRFGLGKGGRHERRRECRRQAGRPCNGARRLQEVPSRDGTLLVSSVSHRTTPVCYVDDDVAGTSP